MNHYLDGAVVGRMCHCLQSGSFKAIDGKRMIAHHFKRIRQIPEKRVVLRISHLAGKTMQGLRCFPEPGPKMNPKCLMAQADAEDWNPFGKIGNGFEGNAGLCRRLRPGRDNQPLRLQIYKGLKGSAMTWYHPAICRAGEQQAVVQNMGKGIPVVQQQPHNKRRSGKGNFRKMALYFGIRTPSIKVESSSKSDFTKGMTRPILEKM